MSLHSWITSTSIRHFPRSPACRPAPYAIEAALNERFSFQVVLRMENEEPQAVRLEVAAPAGWSAWVRRVGCVPVLHHNTPILKDRADIDGWGHIPGYVPDPLFDEDSMLLAPGETQAFWVTLTPGRGARPGRHTVTVKVRPEKLKPATQRIAVRLHDILLQKRRNFHVTHWFYVDALIDWYKTRLFDAKFWGILPAYIRDLAIHGQDTLYVPVFTPPLDGVKRPSQLLRIVRRGRDRYAFDWSDVRRYIRLAKQCGMEHFEWSHPFTQWGVKCAIRIYEGQGADERRLWSPETPATAGVYRAFLSQFLPQLRRFIADEKIEHKSFFHVSDEPHGAETRENYRRARAILRDLAPWMQVMDALSEIEFARQKLTDMPVPSISKALDFVNEGIPCWCYYCCGPRGRYLNRLLDTPLAKIAMHGLLFYRWPLGGFLHWGYNYWYQSQTRNLIDPFQVQDGRRWPGWAFGDPFVVYPGPAGPVDSMRWEVFGESLQDYALLQTLGLDREDRLLAPLKSFAEFPKSEQWRRNTRARLFARIG